jgi:hypothetical protein
MQDVVIGLHAQEWQGAVIQGSVPPDFWEVIDAYRNTQ